MGSDQFLKQTINLAIFIYTNSLGGWMPWQSRHCHDFTTNGDNKARAWANPRARSLCLFSSLQL